MPMKKKHNKSGLGSAVIRQQHLHRNRKPGKDLSRHTVDLNDGEDESKINVKSVTEESSLQNFLSIAELAGTQFTAVPNKCTVLV
ncbi:large subunit GTPase 1-like protein [Leptotrombidium deliense]|uniref:Large subunit GTPase 1-like protein n=1 Tax=Leptotrombidium deliense TaxID=299467 RepID=A0A443SC59_9ACAR|nr:large subunit GTPase 1-like protein [Leptotrombidium deliense]